MAPEPDDKNWPKKLLAEAMLDVAALKDLLGKAMICAARARLSRPLHSGSAQAALLHLPLHRKPLHEPRQGHFLRLLPVQNLLDDLRRKQRQAQNPADLRDQAILKAVRETSSTAC